MTDQQREEEWHLDRKVTLSLIIALFLNAAATVWFAAQLEARVSTLELKDSRDIDTPQRIARVEARVDSLRDYLLRIEDKLDRIIESK